MLGRKLLVVVTLALQKRRLPATFEPWTLLVGFVGLRETSGLEAESTGSMEGSQIALALWGMGHPVDLRPQVGEDPWKDALGSGCVPRDLCPDQQREDSLKVESLVDTAGSLEKGS